MKRILIFAIITLTGCCRQSQRFVLTPTGMLALDTKTGQECLMYPKTMQLAGADLSKFPYCIDLYKSQ